LSHHTGLWINNFIRSIFCPIYYFQMTLKTV
jgi:hypothetical protein